MTYEYGMAATVLALTVGSPNWTRLSSSRYRTPDTVVPAVAVGATMTGMVALRPGGTITGVTEIGPPRDACHRSPVMEVTAGSKASLVASMAEVVGSGVAAFEPKGPTTLGRMAQTPG
jgi:hypothetical protein